MILQQFESIANALTDENNRIKSENANQADEISQLDSKSGDYSLELLDGLKENITKLEVNISKKDVEVNNFTEQLAATDLKVALMTEESREQKDIRRECYAVSGLSFVDEILEVFTKYNKKNHLKLIMMQQSRDLNEKQKELATTSKSLLETSKDIDPPGFSDVVSIENCSNSFKNFLNREKKRQRIAMLRSTSASAPGCASPSASTAILSRRPISEIEGEN